MRALLCLIFFAAGCWCAPLAEQDTVAEAVGDVADNELRVKRAKEAIMFGNQQNGAKEVKKRDDPVLAEVNQDKEGDVVVHDPVEIQDLVQSNTDDIEEKVKDSVEEHGNEMEETATETEDVNETTEDGASNGDETTELEIAGDDMSNNGYEEYLKELNDPYFKTMYYNMLNRVKPDYYNRGRNPMYRYRRSQAGRFNPAFFPRSTQHLKRSHRTKRDLYLPYDVFSQQYLPYDDSYYNRPYNNYPMDEDELSYLLDALDQSRGYDDDDDVTDYVKYDNYVPYNGYTDDDEDEYLPLYETPLKRQAGLQFVPGIKRSREFYPYFLEPGTHFQAFVPEKRSLADYADAYEKVMELAAALRRQNYYPAGLYGYESDYVRRRR